MHDNDRHKWLVKLDTLTVATELTETAARVTAADLIKQASATAYTRPGQWRDKAAQLEFDLLAGKINFARVSQWLIAIGPYAEDAR